MSTFTVTKRNTSNPRAPAARLIPGVASVPISERRKKPQSVSLDGSYWTASPDPAPSGLGTLQMLAQAVLPTPAKAGQRTHLAQRVSRDLICVWLTFATVSYLRSYFSSSFAPPSPASSLGAVFVHGALLTLLAYSEGLYQDYLVWTPQTQRVLLGKVVGLFTVMAAPGFLFSNFFPWTAFVATAPLNYIFMLCCREWERRAAIRSAGRRARNVLIVGSTRLGQELAASFTGDSKSGRLFRGFLAEQGPIGGDVRGTIEDLARVARAEFIDEIILLDIRDPVRAGKIIREARRNRLDVKIVPDLFGFRPQALEDVGNIPVLTLHEEAIPATGLLLKRLLDVCVSSAALLILTPVLGIVALCIRCDSPGPVLYGAPRVGRKGRRFRCFKFRTMVSGADLVKDVLRARNQREGPFFKIANDPRITRVGRFLRHFSLDELPQLWNVLRGDMSLVGPRPHPIDDCERYDLDHLRRLDVTPGVTGLWQVTARRDPSFERNMALDLQYIEEWSLALDLRILLKTIAVVLKGTGA